MKFPWLGTALDITSAIKNSTCDDEMLVQLPPI